MFNKMIALPLAAVVLLVSGVAARGDILFSDNFHGGMSGSWAITRPNSSYYSFQPGYLDLRANSGDIWLNESNALNLFLVQNPTAGNFIVTLGLNSFNPTTLSNAPQIALLAYDSDNAYVRADFGSHGFYWPLQRAIEFAYETPSPNTYNPVITAADFGSNPFYLRMQKIGNVYTEYYSTDGTAFVQVNGSITFGNGTPLELGFAAMSDPNQSSHAYINSFQIQSVPEPGTFLLMGASVIGLMGRRRMRS